MLKPLDKLIIAVKQIQQTRRPTLTNVLDLLELTKVALLKPLKNRTPEDIEAVEKMMLQYKFFQDLKLQQGLSLFKDFCQELYIRETTQGDKVIKKGYYGQTFFVVLSGSVGVVIYNPKTTQAENQITNQQLMLNKGKNLVPEYDNPKLFDSKEIAALESGSTFGDMALLQSNAITSATVVTRCPCLFACMDKKTFWKYLGKERQQELDQKLKFLKLIPFLQGWHEQELKTLSLEFKVQNYYKRQIICHQQKLKLGLYIIISGEVELSKRVIQQNVQFIGMQKKPQDVNLKVSMLGPYQYFGDGPSDQCEYTATCESTVARLYFIAKQDLENRLQWNAQSTETYLSLATVHSEFYGQREKLLHAKMVPQVTLMDNDGQLVEVRELKQCLSLPPQHNQKQVNAKHQYAKPYERVSKVNNKWRYIDFLNVVGVLDQSQLQDEDFQVKGRLTERKVRTPQQAIHFTVNKLDEREAVRQEKKLKLQFQLRVEKISQGFLPPPLKPQTQRESIVQTPIATHSRIATQSPIQTPPHNEMHTQTNGYLGITQSSHTSPRRHIQLAKSQSFNDCDPMSIVQSPRAFKVGMMKRKCPESMSTHLIRQNLSSADSPTRVGTSPGVRRTLQFKNSPLLQIKTMQDRLLVSGQRSVQTERSSPIKLLRLTNIVFQREVTNDHYQLQ